MELFNLKYNAYLSYCLGTGGNSEIDYETAKRKLTRNISLAKPEQIDEVTIKYHYGNLKITVNTKTKLITKVKNTKSKPESWGKNQKKYRKLNSKLDIPMEVSR